jgi:hypothetical protein
MLDLAGQDEVIGPEFAKRLTILFEVCRREAVDLVLLEENIYLPPHRNQGVCEAERL